MRHSIGFYNYYTICFFLGKPQIAIINSSPEGLYRNKYNLTWTVKSIQPLTEVRLLFRMMVSFESSMCSSVITNGVKKCVTYIILYFESRIIW